MRKPTRIVANAARTPVRLC